MQASCGIMIPIKLTHSPKALGLHWGYSSPPHHRFRTYV